VALLQYQLISEFRFNTLSLPEEAGVDLGKTMKVVAVEVLAVIATALLEN